MHKSYKQNQKKEKTHTEVVNGMELHYKYTKKSQSFDAKQYKSSIDDIAAAKKVKRPDIDQASFDRVVSLPNTTVQRNPFHSVTHPHSQPPQPRQSPLMQMHTVSSATHTISAAPIPSTVSASPRQTHPSMHRQYHSDERPSYRQPQYHTEPHPAMSSQPQSYPYPYPPQGHNAQHQYHQTMPNRIHPVHVQNAYVDNNDGRSPTESSSEYKTEYAATEAITIDTNAADCGGSDTEKDSPVVVQQFHAQRPKFGHGVVDTLTSIVNQAKHEDVVMIKEDREESYVMGLQPVGMNKMSKNVSYGTHASSIDANREPSFVD